MEPIAVFAECALDSRSAGLARGPGGATTRARPEADAVKPQLNPLVQRLAGYMQEKMNAVRDAAVKSGKPVFDFGIGDPREPTPPFIREALRDAVPEVSQYPSIAGLPALRKAIAVCGANVSTIASSFLP